MICYTTNTTEATECFNGIVREGVFLAEFSLGIMAVLLLTCLLLTLLIAFAGWYSLLLHLYGRGWL
jgi:hypothetical protein